MNVCSANWIFSKMCIHTLACLYFSYNVSYMNAIIVIIINNEYLLFAYCVPGTVLKGSAHAHLTLMTYESYGKPFL